MPGSYRERNSTSDRTLDILSLFTDERPRLTASELAARLGTARSTAYRYLQTLTASGLVEEDGGGGFRLGMRIFELARVARRSYGFADVVGPVLADLARATGETALLTRRHGAFVVCLDKHEADGRVLRISYERGSVFAPNAGASALILFAWDDPADLTARLKSVDLPHYTPVTPASPAEIVAALAPVRAQGYLVSQGTLDPDAVGVAAPVRDSAGSVIAAVSVVAVASRVAPGDLDHLISEVLKSAGELTETLALVAN
jgi:DNA-binding IclR family transcriptional regulator